MEKKMKVDVRNNIMDWIYSRLEAESDIDLAKVYTVLNNFPT